jgi:hypothetical protein
MSSFAAPPRQLRTQFQVRPVPQKEQAEEVEECSKGLKSLVLSALAGAAAAGSRGALAQTEHGVVIPNRTPPSAVPSVGGSGLQEMPVDPQGRFAQPLASFDADAGGVQADVVPKLDFENMEKSSTQRLPGEDIQLFSLAPEEQKYLLSALPSSVETLAGQSSPRAPVHVLLKFDNFNSAGLRTDAYNDRQKIAFGVLDRLGVIPARVKVDKTQVPGVHLPPDRYFKSFEVEASYPSLLTFRNAFDQIVEDKGFLPHVDGSIDANLWDSLFVLVFGEPVDTAFATVQAQLSAESGLELLENQDTEWGVSLLPRWQSAVERALDRIAPLKTEINRQFADFLGYERWNILDTPAAAQEAMDAMSPKVQTALSEFRQTVVQSVLDSTAQLKVLGLNALYVNRVPEPKTLSQRLTGWFGGAAGTQRASALPKESPLFNVGRYKDRLSIGKRREFNTARTAVRRNRRDRERTYIYM